MADNIQHDIDEKYVQNGDIEAPVVDNEQAEWKPSKKVLQVLFCLSIIGLMASLDMSIFLPILPVSTV